MEKTTSLKFTRLEEIEISEKMIEIFNFWFPKDTSFFRKQWFNNSLDSEIKDKYYEIFEKATTRKYLPWNSPRDLVTLIIIYDQFSRNLFRGTSQAYQNDSLAIKFAKLFFESKFDSEHYYLGLSHIIFALMPFRHSENLEDQKFVINKISELKTRFPSCNLLNKFELYSIKSYQTILEHGSFNRFK